MNRITKVAVSLIIVVILASVFIVFNSKFKKQGSHAYQSIRESVIINASVKDVFTYMGNSANASDWSVFVDHITPLNPDSVNDGSVGSRRRCFTSADESGPTWDETIVIEELSKRRRLTIYNMVNFKMTSDHLLTEQIYEALNDSTCKLTLSVFLDDSATLIDEFKMHIVSNKISQIFANNLKNIKRLSEEYAATRVIYLLSSRNQYL